MPRIDSISGCSVMTQAEFWNSEAEFEGKGRSGSDLMQDFRADFETERKAEEDRLKEPENALGIILEAFYPGDDGEDENQRPLKVIEVCELSCDMKMRSTTIRIKALCECKDGKPRLFIAMNYSDSGTRMQPPEVDFDCQVSELP
jgi:hypothetical protein